MEIEGIVFIGAAIIAATQFIKYLVPGVQDAVTIAVSVALGILVALVDQEIGVANLTIAEGIMAGLAASGAHNVARQVG